MAVFLESAVSVSSSDFSTDICADTEGICTEGVRRHLGRGFFSISFEDRVRIWLRPNSDKQTPSRKKVFGIFGGSVTSNNTTYSTSIEQQDRGLPFRFCWCQNIYVSTTTKFGHIHSCRRWQLQQRITY